MLTGILFIVIVWFIPLIIWYFVQGKNEFSLKPNCNSLSKEQKMSKWSFFAAIGFGILCILLIIFFQ